MADSTSAGPNRRFANPFRTVLTTLLASFLPWIPQPALAEPELDPSRLVSEIRSVKLDSRGAVQVSRLEVEMGPGRLFLEDGVLIPARIGDGRAIELVFLGNARFRIEPPDRIEAGQLELFTGRTELDVAVEEAVLVLANRTALDNLLDSPAGSRPDPKLVQRGIELHQEWRHSTARRNGGIDAAVFRSMVGDLTFQNFFTLWCRKSEVGEFIFQLDPEDIEQITLASFNPARFTSWERARMRRHIRIQQRKGRWLDMRFQDLGAWDIWLSMPWSPSDGTAWPGNVGFESRHYDLDVKITRRLKRLEGRARLRVEAIASKRRVVRLQMLSDLIVDTVRDEAGKSLFWFRTGNDLLILLPRSPEVGDEFVLDVGYSGRVLNWVGGKAFDLEDTSAWYPHCGTNDRATYDVTLRWPRKYNIAASGRRIDHGQEGDHLWARRRLDIPSMAFSFVMGDFAIDRHKVGDVEIEMAFHRDPSFKLTESIREQMLETVSRSLVFFESTFGEYPLDYLTVVTIPRKFSQSYLGFVTLAGSILEHSTSKRSSSNWIRDTTIAHELAHQWWGNLVGWYSYRDQWLSEGMANYSALLFDKHMEEKDTNLLAVMSAGWRQSLSQTILDGRTIESLGPVVLGGRLNSSRARYADRPIVYRKGAVVLAMLARAVGEEHFLEMLRSFSEAASHRVMTTENFLKAVERMSGLNLDGFARQYIYGTGIPQVYYDYELSPAGEGNWKVEGQARLMLDPHLRHVIVRHGSGRWDVERRPGPLLPIDKTTLMVPYQVLLDSGETRTAMEGRLFLEGRSDGFAVETSMRPLELKLDPRGEVLAWFYSEAQYPKRVLRYQARDLLHKGEIAEAEARYRAALSSTGTRLTDHDPLRPTYEAVVDGDMEDFRIELELVRLFLLQNRDTEAGELLDGVDLRVAVDPMLLRMERDVLRARLEVRAEDYESAFRRLKKVLRMAVPRHHRSTWRDLVQQRQLTHDGLAVTEAFSLLAIAALETGHRDDLKWAADQARERGVDVSVLSDETATERTAAQDPRPRMSR